MVSEQAPRFRNVPTVPMVEVLPSDVAMMTPSGLQMVSVA